MNIVETHFRESLHFVGDGQMATEVVTGDKLLDLPKLQEVGKKCSLEVPISKSRRELQKKLFALEETGPTALGPALAVSCAMASVKNGSKVILCTVCCYVIISLSIAGMRIICVCFHADYC